MKRARVDRHCARYPTNRNPIKSLNAIQTSKYDDFLLRLIKPSFVNFPCFFHASIENSTQIPMMPAVSRVYFRKAPKEDSYYGVVLLMAPVKMVSRTTTTAEAECVCALLRHIRNAGVSCKFPLIVNGIFLQWRRRRSVKLLIWCTSCPPTPALAHFCLSAKW